MHPSAPTHAAGRMQQWAIIIHAAMTYAIWSCSMMSDGWVVASSQCWKDSGGATTTCLDDACESHDSRPHQLANMATCLAAPNGALEQACSTWAHTTNAKPAPQHTTTVWMLLASSATAIMYPSLIGHRPYRPPHTLQ